MFADIQARGITDIHLAIKDAHPRYPIAVAPVQNQWVAEVIYNSVKKLPGALKVHECMSCSLGGKLSIGAFDGGHHTKHHRRLSHCELRLRRGTHIRTFQ